MLIPQWPLALIAALGLAPAAYGQNPVQSEYALLQLLPVETVQKLWGRKSDVNGMVIHHPDCEYFAVR